MQYVFEKATTDDLSLICQLFDEAILFQKRNGYRGWDSYDKDHIIADIKNGLLIKVLKENDMVCFFTICFNDPLIWREKENDNAIYLHRIVLNRKFAGEKMFSRVLDWTIEIAREKNLKYIRMDTWAENEKLISYYKNYNFKFVENYTTPDTQNLPTQHRNLNVALLELDVKTTPAFQRNSINNDPKASENYDLTKMNIPQELLSIRKYWSQKVIGRANGQLIKLAKGIGEINWHKHDDQDELFILFKGHLTIQLRDRNIELNENDLFIVPSGVEHCPKADGEAQFLIMGLNITSNPAGGRPDNWTYEGTSR